ncbi:BAD_collapsed_G0033320.mRNA.1.CDS.1 [Saccharomyces cerevisiae]|nr:BAD_HP_G0022230.mRNA.1.CDS.1 [Saccharomyces cerevisiae]CAI4984813.1 BAD_HP_G0054080.mRNA.1.CDS.1 [Saccharomyces cerevisiae]CAI6543073.1 BAD_HP_G0022230.mRNA.1.CDS.1 [Saccharomyces cerevisiae]CAI6839123.1 BAD_HP_G0054080.mRNA.1.CDS.1 [Saccharomyces cerevisiae]CAI7388266.1 BAD_collapsed_G0033320.mRNA.1.CDS.1 [Saccharomyces cerevisiae]
MIIYKNTTYVATLIYEFIILNDASMTPDVKCFWLPVKLPHFLLLSELYSIIEKHKLAKVYYNRGTYDVHTVSANSLVVSGSMPTGIIIGTSSPLDYVGVQVNRQLEMDLPIE